MSFLNLHNDAAGDLAFEDCLDWRFEFFERHGPAYERFEVSELPVAGQLRPERDALGHGIVGRFDADKLHAAEDERVDGGRQVHAGRQSAGGDAAAVTD